MLVKFETKSQRVKGISFHPTRPWVIASLHSGEIQLWDYRISTMIAKFEEHEGPVRGIDFHKTQPLFVSAGDDYKIKGWNYKTKKCLWTLKGHLDYIRTVYFHNELPWILSCSDDQTVRIWNYQSRSLLSILTGHGHYVMCAQFHPTKDLIISCSLDQTLRLWDFTQLKKKYTTALGAKSKPSEATSSNDVETRAILEGHDRGVNWCAFHPTLNLIVSAADDRKVKLWKYTETKAWEHDSLYGHSNNVCCAVFHEKLDVIVSNSEDKTIKVWDLNRRVCVDTFKKDTDRFWILAVHPELHIVGAGSDSGMALFNLQSERVAATLVNNGNDLFYAHKKNLMYREVKSGREVVLKAIDHTPTNPSLNYQRPHQIYHNPFNTQSHNILLLFKDKDLVYHKYILYQMDYNIEKAKSNITSQFRYCLSAVFVTKDKIAVLKHTNDIEILDVNSGSVKAITGLPNADMIFPGPLGKIIVRSEDSVLLYDTTAKKIVGAPYVNNEIPKLKRVYWNHNYNYVALVCKKTIIILNKLFANPVVINEKFTVISCIWSSDSVLMYTTNNHLRYSLLNGDTGILRCLEAPAYLLQAKEGEVLTIDRDAKVDTITFDREEYLFKLALQQKDSQKLRQIIASHKRLGNSLIAYLYRKNYSALALHLVQNTRARFSLALDSGNLEIAYKTSYELKDKECYTQLGEEALRQGNQQIVEVAYQNTRNYERLSMLYLLTGNLPKLEKMLLIAQNRNDTMSRFHNALYLGDVQERIRVLAEVGLLHLAYIMAVNHNIEEMAQPLKESIADSLPTGDYFKNAKALVPLRPLITDTTSSPQTGYNWPQHQLLEDELVLSQDEPEVQETETQNVDLDMAVDVPQTKHVEEEAKPISSKQQEAEADNWGIDDDIEIAEQPSTETTQTSYNFQDQSDGRDRIIEKVSNSLLAGEHASCGMFTSAKTLLSKQIGASNFEPLEPVLRKIHAASSIQLTGFPYTNSITHQMLHENGRPVVLGSVEQLRGLLKLAYNSTTAGKFAEAIKQFRELLYHVPLLVLKTSDEEEDVKTLIKISTEYILALKIDAVKRTTTDPARSLELSGYMAACNLQPTHRILSLRAAMGLAHKLKDYIYAAFFAKKIVQLAEQNPTSTKPEVIDNAKKVYADCERKGSNEHTINFEESMLKESEAHSIFCANSLTLLKGKNKSKCPFCSANYDSKFNGEVCEICLLSKVGAVGLGLKIH